MQSSSESHEEYRREADALSRLLRSQARRGQFLSLFLGLAWSGAFVIALFSALVAAMGWWGGDTLRWVGWGGCGAVLIATVLIVVLPLRRLTRPDGIARRIGRTFPTLASDVLSASQLTRREATPFSPYMMAAHLRSVRLMLLSALKRNPVFPIRQLILPLLLLSISVAGAGAAFALAPHIMDVGVRSLITERIPISKKHHRIAAKAPVLGDITIQLKYPEYLERPDRELTSVSGGFVAPLGTSVTIQGRALVPAAEKGEIFLPDGGRSAMTVSRNGAVRGSFVVAEEGAFHIALGSEGVWMEGPARNIETERDGIPNIRLLRPTGSVELAAGDELILSFEAEDDHSLDHMDVVIRYGDDTELRKTIVRFADKVKRIKTRYRWTPESIRLGEETELMLELEAFDNDTILGPKPGRTDSLRIKFLTAQSRHLSALESQNETLDKLIDLLAYRLETPVPSSKQNEESKARFAIIRGQSEDLLAKTASLIGVLNRDSLTPKRVVDTFVQIRQDLSNQLMFEARLYERETLGEFKERLGVDRVTRRLLERSIIRVDDLIIDQQLSRVVHTGGVLEAGRTELSRLLARYLETRSESVRRTLLDAIAKMEAEVEKLEKHLSQVRGKVGDAYINPSAVLHMDLLGSLAKLKALLAGDDVNNAVSLVRRMETDLGRLLAGLEGGLLSFRTERFGEGERFLGELLDRVISLESGQLQVRRETIALKRAYQERLADAMRGKINPLVKRQLKRVDRIKHLLKKLKVSPGSTFEEILSRLKTMEGELTLALRQGDLDEARKVSEEIADAADEWLDAGNRPDRPVAEIAREAEGLTKEVSNAYPRPKELLPNRDARLSQSRAVDQRALISKTRKLKGWIGKQNEEAKFLSTRALESLTQVTRRMARSVKHLEKTEIGDALEEQSAALDELARLREDLKRGDEVAPLESRPVILTGRVNLPDPDEFEVPPEFRDDILEAMRGDLPGQYEEAIKKYYERLVK